MSKNRTGAATIPRLLSFAYRHAIIGEGEKAREFWATAVSRGYIPKLKMVRRFDKTIQEGSHKTSSH